MQVLEALAPFSTKADVGVTPASNGSVKKYLPTEA
jgi:hypothetical protein